MIWFILIALILACGVLVMMRDEIRDGYVRWRDYMLVVPLLYGTGAVIYWLAGWLPPAEGLWLLVLLPVRILLGFALLIVVWGGTITAGAVLMRFCLRRSFH